MKHNLIAALSSIPRIRRVCPNKIRPCAAVALAVTLALGGSHLAAQALLEEEAAAPLQGQTEGATTNTTGTGTNGKIPRWTSNTSLGNSIITQANGKIGIGTATPAAKLTVNGADPEQATIRGANTSSGAGITGSSANGSGVVGTTSGSFGSGVLGRSTVMEGTGVRGESTKEDGTGVYGEGAAGVSGRSTVKDGIGVRGESTEEGGVGVSGNGAFYGVSGQSDNVGVAGFSQKVGVLGFALGDQGRGVFGSASGQEAAGVYGENQNGVGVRGIGTNGAGVYGEATGYHGVIGYSDTGSGVRGNSSGAGGRGVFGEADGINAVGVYGVNSAGPGVWGDGGATGTGVRGTTANPDGSGVFGEANGANSSAVYGRSNHRAVFGHGTGEGIGVYGDSAGGPAGFFVGNVVVTGTLFANFVAKSGGNFEIDHPLDPAHKLLAHSFVESPDMMNIYNGNAELDEHGEATVQMPDYFAALNQDYRYQLTAVEAAAPNLHVAQRMKGNQFKISGGQPGMTVSWQVTGVRHDAYANAHRIAVETEKSAAQVGRYVNPELFGEPKERAIGLAEHPMPGNDPESVAVK